MFRVPLGWSRKFMAEFAEPYVTLGVPFSVVFHNANHGVIRATVHFVTHKVEYELSLPVGSN